MSTSAHATRYITPAARCSSIVPNNSYLRSGIRGLLARAPRRRRSRRYDIRGAAHVRDAIEDDPRLESSHANAGDDADGDAPAPETGVKIWSDRGGLADKDFAAFTAEEIAEARKALARLVWNPGVRRTRRWVRGRGRASIFGARSAKASARWRRGEAAARKRRVRPRPLVLLCDVSGSMERYSRMLLHFAHALTSRHQRVEAFLFRRS